MRSVGLQPLVSRDPWTGAGIVAEAVNPQLRNTARSPRLLDRVRTTMRLRHYSRRTERAYAQWIRRFVRFHEQRHPSEMGREEVTRFLSAFAIERRVSASTQNQALAALLFLYGQVLGVELPWLDELVRAARPERLPVVLSRNEVRAVLQQLHSTHRLMTSGRCRSSSVTATSARR